jgi:hypothetical protein
MTSLRDLIDEAAALGYAAEPTAGSHIRFTHPSGALVHAASTPSDRRAWLNTRADLRRELRARGIAVEVRSLPPKEPRKARPTPPPSAAKPAPAAFAGVFRPTGQHGRLAGTIDGRPALLELRRGPEGQWLAMRWADGAGAAT